MGAAACWFCLILGLPGLALTTPTCTVCDGSESLSLRQLRGVKTSITTEAVGARHTVDLFNKQFSDEKNQIRLMCRRNVFASQRFVDIVRFCLRCGL